jgi:hypothetical protein
MALNEQLNSVVVTGQLLDKRLQMRVFQRN